MGMLIKHVGSINPRHLHAVERKNNLELTVEQFSGDFRRKSCKIPGFFIVNNQMYSEMIQKCRKIKPVCKDANNVTTQQ